MTSMARPKIGLGMTAVGNATIAATSRPDSPAMPQRRGVHRRSASRLDDMPETYPTGYLSKVGWGPGSPTDHVIRSLGGRRSRLEGDVPSSRRLLAGRLSARWSSEEIRSHVGADIHHR